MMFIYLRILIGNDHSQINKEFPGKFTNVSITDAAGIGPDGKYTHPLGKQSNGSHSDLRSHSGINKIHCYEAKNSCYLANPRLLLISRLISLGTNSSSQILPFRVHSQSHPCIPGLGTFCFSSPLGSHLSRLKFFV